MTRRLGAVVALLVAAAGLPLLPSARAAAPAGEWLAGDLHVHTTYSHDSYGGPGDDNTGPDEAYVAGLTVEQQFTVAAARGLDFLAITDHNDVRSQTDPGFGAAGVLPVRGYENSLDGHAQMLGAGHIYDNGDDSTAAVQALADQLRADGGAFQVNHPREGGEVDWSYEHEVVPDTVEVWNISRLYQPPLPSASDNEAAVRYWEGFLDAGHHVAATGGSDSHWASTTAVQGPGNPTTWVYATDRSEAAVLRGLREGRTSISARPPALGGARIYLEADGDGDGADESVVGDTVPAGARVRARVEGAAGATLRLVGTGGHEVVDPVPVTADRFEHAVELPAGTTWVRAEVTRGGDELIEAMTSALYVDDTRVAVRVDDGEVTLSNRFVERTWSLAPFRTERLVDRRTAQTWSAASPDFRLVLDGAEVRSDTLTASAPTAERLDGGGVRLTFDLGIADRVVEAWPDVAGFRSRTVLKVPGVLSGYTLDEAALGPAAVTLHSFRSGADWRSDEGWSPDLAVGDANEGTWRATTAGRPGAAVSATAQWLSADRAGRRLFMVMERNDHASSTMRYDGGTAAAFVDLSRDVVYAGPLEEQVHVQNPGPGPARHRAVTPPLALEPVFTGMAVDADDEPWQHWVYLSRHRLVPYRKAVTWNSNNVDDDRISTGAKDDMDLAEVRRQADVARRIGVDTFILDDGWQARSGDWCPDSPECPEPRADRLGHRFPDPAFAAVRAELGEMDLGLWMSPMHFHTSSEAYRQHPEWACTPVGDGTAGLTALQPEDGSNEAGLGTWNPRAAGMTEHIESRIRRAIEDYGVRYFKFDFLVWVDCLDVAPADLYQYREAFLALLDRLQAAHPEVTFQIDETNDYRLFPFESVYRGPSWFQNGAPRSPQLLHNLWNLAPYVPGFSLGQHVLSNDEERAEVSTDYLMAVALGSHLTFWDDLTELTPTQVATARSWVDFYKGNRDRLATFTYPLLDDPKPGNNWTALQPWDDEAGRGMVLVYRQDTAVAKKRVPLRGVDRKLVYRVTDARTGRSLGAYTGHELRTVGVPVALPTRFSAAVLSVDPVRP